MTDGAETKKQRPENFHTVLAQLDILYRDFSRKNEYDALIQKYHEGAQGKLPDDLDLASWAPEDYHDLLNFHQQTIQGGSL